MHSYRSMGRVLPMMALAACAHSEAKPPAPSQGKPAAEETQPVPADLQAQVAQAEQLGAALYAYDSAAWIATDAALEGRDRESLGLGGYLVFPEGDETGMSGAWQALFYSAGDAPKIVRRVRLLEGQKPVVTELRPPEEPVAGLDLLIRARATAVASLQSAGQPINPVIMPGSAIGQEGILVYLLAGTAEPKRVVFGLHHRVLVSGDGTRVLRAEPLSKSALVLPLEPDAEGREPAILIVSHLVSSTPIETHVLASLQHGIRVGVATDRGDWIVDGAHITYLGPREE